MRGALLIFPLTLILSAPARSAEIEGKAPLAVSPAALARVIEQRVPLWPRDAVGLCQAFEGLQATLGGTALPPEDSAALALVVGALAGEPRSAQRLAASGLTPERLETLAQAAARLKEASAAHPPLAQALEAVRARAEAGPAAKGSGALELLRRWAERPGGLDEAAAPAAAPEDEPLIESEPPPGTPRHIRRTKWKTRFLTDLSDPQKGSEVVALAARELTGPELAGLVRGIMDATLEPGSKYLPATDEEAAKYKFAIEAIASLYSQHDWGQSSLQSQLFQELFHVVSSKQAPTFDADTLGRVALSDRPTIHPLSTYSRGVSAIAAAVEKRPDLLLGHEGTETYFLGALALLGSILSNSANLNNSYVKTSVAEAAMALRKTLSALLTLAQAGPRGLSKEGFVSLESRLEKLAEAAAISQEVKADAWRALEALERHAPEEPPEVAAGQALVLAPKKSASRALARPRNWKDRVSALSSGQAAGIITGMTMMPTMLLAWIGLAPQLVIFIGSMLAILLTFAFVHFFGAPREGQEEETELLPARDPEDPEHLAELQALEDEGLGLTNDERFERLEEKYGHLFPKLPPKQGS